MKTILNSSNIELQNYLPRLVAVGLLAAVLLLALIGCKGNATTGSTKLDPAGVYALVSVDGKTVPCDISHEGAAVKVKSGTITIMADGTCSSDITFNVANHRDVNRVVKAVWTSQGAQLTMQWEGAGTTLGLVNGNAFTMTNEGMVFAYRK